MRRTVLYYSLGAAMLVAVLLIATLLGFSLDWLKVALAVTIFLVAGIGFDLLHSKRIRRS